MTKTVFSILSALLLGLTAAADDKKADPIDAKKLVGKWTPKEKKEGAPFVIDFTTDGKVTSAISRDGKEMKAEGTYAVDGNKLTLTLKLGDKEVKMVRTVSKLTDDELTSSDEGGKEDTLVRIKDKK